MKTAGALRRCGYVSFENNALGVFYLATEMGVNAATSSETIAGAVAELPGRILGQWGARVAGSDRNQPTGGWNGGLVEFGNVDLRFSRRDGVRHSRCIRDPARGFCVPASAAAAGNGESASPSRANLVEASFQLSALSNSHAAQRPLGRLCVNSADFAGRFAAAPVAAGAAAFPA